MLFFEPNQDATFRCRINNGDYVSCEQKVAFVCTWEYTIFCTGTSPHTFTNVGVSDSVTVTVEGTTVLRSPPQTVTVTKNGNLLTTILYLTTIFTVSMYF